MSDMAPEFLTVGTGEAARRIAVRVRQGGGPPVVWLGGFRSDMTATKATALDAWASQRGRTLIRFDYAAHGASSGTFTECTISSWLEDAQAVLAAYATEAPILVGSSMGGGSPAWPPATGRTEVRRPPVSCSSPRPWISPKS